jgi:hypothetical protein
MSESIEGVPANIRARYKRMPPIDPGENAPSGGLKLFTCVECRSQFFQRPDLVSDPVKCHKHSGDCLMPQ